MLDGALQRVPLDRLRQRELSDAQALQAEQRVRGLEREHELVLGQRQVAGLRAVPVNDGGHATRPAGTAGGALAELSAELGLDTDLRHDVSPLDKSLLSSAHEV